MALKDFIYVPKVNDFNVGGEMIIVYDNYNPYRVAYQSEDEYTIRAGVYHQGAETFQFIFTSPNAINSGIDIILQSPYLSVVDRLTEINTPLPGDIVGYYGVMNFSKDRMSTNIKNQSNGVKWFDNLHLLYSTLSYGQAPSPSDGVVVTCIASPVTPSNDGVIVTCVAKLADPNQQGGTSEPGGGQGTFNDYSDPIPLPPLPTISAANVGLVTLFRPSETQLRSLGSYLWTNITDFIENLNKLFINPMDYMIALNIFPCNPDVGDERSIKIGSFSTTISMPPVLSQWYEHNCGTLVTNEYWGSALDYAPNTKISLMLPFIGNVQLNPDEIMEKRLGIKYRIDLLSGQCVALISVDDNILYQFTGECSVSVPLTGSDWSRIYSAVVGAIGTAITTGVSTGGIIDVAKTTGRAATAGDRIRRANSIAAGRITGGIANTVNQVMNGKGGINHSGSISGSAGMLGMRYPYLMIEFPNQSLANNYRHFVGYPSNMGSKLGNLKGYTEVEQVIPEGFWGTDDELAELMEALKGGVYL